MGRQTQTQQISRYFNCVTVSFWSFLVDCNVQQYQPTYTRWQIKGKTMGAMVAQAVEALGC